MLRLTNSIRREIIPADCRIREIVSLAYINNSENWHFHLHEHENYCELVYIAGGEGEYVIDNRSYAIREGDIALINKNTGHIQISSPNNPLTIWNLSIRVRETETLGENILLPRTYQAVFSAGLQKAACEQCCQELFREMKERGEHYEAMSLLWADRLFLLVDRVLKDSGQIFSERTGNLAKLVKQYINEHYAEKISLDSLSRVFRSSKYHISHEMKRIYRLSPIDYVIDRRIGESQNLLCTTQLTVTEIAARVGYDNVNYFNKLFNKKLGINPTDFRKKYENIK